MIIIHRGSPEAYPGILFGVRGVQQNQINPEGRENGDLGAVAPYLGVSLILQMSEVVTDVYSKELGIWLSFVKTSEFRKGGG
jgi:hypothetical protein